MIFSHEFYGLVHKLVPIMQDSNNQEEGIVLQGQ